jgi:DNA-directed RNA polymerase specialized sigma24 family protein
LLLVEKGLVDRTALDELVDSYENKIGLRKRRTRGALGQMKRIRNGSLLMALRQLRLLALDGVLEKLAHMNPRQAMMVEIRFFGGLEIVEIADCEVSEVTVLPDWRAARAWLAQELKA